MHTSSLQSSKRVELWLENIANSPTTVYDPSNRKRKQPLEEMSNNISTPKRHRTNATTLNSQHDENETPRPSRHPWTHEDDIAPAHAYYGDLPPTPESSHASSASIGGRKRKRGESPAKQMAGLRYARYPTIQERFSRLADLPCEVRVLAATMRRLGKGIRVIPSRYKQWLSELGNGDSDDLTILDQEGESDNLGQTPGLDITSRITRHASRNEKLGCAEAAWNANVHSTILDEAWHCSVHRNATRWDSITTAAIEPQELVPEITQRERVQSKKADFAISLELEEDTECCLARAGIQLNQTTYEGVRFNPIVVSIETKLPGEGGSDAKLQLATWGCSQIAKLRELLALAGNKECPIPPLPLIIAQGHDWHFLCLEDRRDRAIFWNGINFGSTACPLGVYQVIKGLQFLLNWAQRIYRPWFEQRILIPILEKAVVRTGLIGQMSLLDKENCLIGRRPGRNNTSVNFSADDAAFRHEEERLIHCSGE